MEKFHNFLLYFTVVSTVDGTVPTLLTLPNISVVFLSINYVFDLLYGKRNWSKRHSDRHKNV